MSRRRDLVSGFALVILGVWLLANASIFFTAWSIRQSYPSVESQGDMVFRTLSSLGPPGLGYYSILLALANLAVAATLAQGGGGPDTSPRGPRAGLRILSTLLLLAVGVWLLLSGTWLTTSATSQGFVEGYNLHPGPSPSLMLVSLLTLPLLDLWVGLLMTWDWDAGSRLA